MGTTATLDALAPALPGRSAAIRSGSQLGPKRKGLENPITVNVEFADAMGTGVVSAS